jgi:putative membrane protein
VTPPDELGDATRRTWLANERTWLAWIRTGLTSTAVSIALGRIVPDLAHLTRWPYAVIGGGYAVLGAALMVYGFIRKRDVEVAIERGGYAAPHDTVMLAFAAVATVLALATGVVVIVT